MIRSATISCAALAFLGASFANAASVIDRIKPNTFKPNTLQNFSSYASPMSGPDADTYMLTLSCGIGDNLRSISRIAVMKTQKNDGSDYALISGHGLSGQTLETMGGHGDDDLSGCYVQDFSGHKARITDFSLAPNFTAGTATDWGIIRFKAMPTASLVRYDLPDIQWGELGRDAVPVRFAAARGLRHNSQNCEILPSRYQVLKGPQFDGVMPHTCRAISGQSGSPMSLDGNAPDLLMGIHLGRTWMLRPPVTGRPAFQGFVRVIDAPMIHDIQTMIETMP